MEKASLHKFENDHLVVGYSAVSMMYVSEQSRACFKTRTIVAEMDIRYNREESSAI